jgi:GNAT superfamily N-acetyltransferase
LTPGVDPARIRAFFVHPDAARQGVGAAILSACEAAAIEAGLYPSGEHRGAGVRALMA